MDRGTVQLRQGSVFAGAYRIERMLSAGGMGAVYVAEQLATGRQRALKLMHPQLAANAGFRERFGREARIGAQIASEHVVEVVDAGVDDATGSPYLAMELLDGEDLYAMVQRRGPLSGGEVALIFEQLCHALSAAHEVGVVHRDLKPENVFVAYPKRAGAGGFHVKVLDFGIAKVVAMAQTTSTGIIGTPLWMAPEQTSPDGQISRATDLWPLGLIAFFLFTGRFYWRTPNREGGEVSAMALLREVALEPLAPASERARAIGCEALLPTGFDAWFARAVARQPEARFPTAAALHEALLALLGVQPSAPGSAPTQHGAPSVATQGVPSHVHASTFTPAVAPPPPTAARSRLPLVLGALLIAVVGVVAIFFAVRAVTRSPKTSSRRSAREATESAARSSGTYAPPPDDASESSAPPDPRPEPAPQPSVQPPPLDPSPSQPPSEKQQLLAKVNGGTATCGEMKRLQALCGQEGDVACRARATAAVKANCRRPIRDR